MPLMVVVDMEMVVVVADMEIETIGRANPFLI